MKTDLSILVIDDEQIMRNLFTDILQDEGYKVTAVSNGEEAGDRLKGEFFDIAFIDIHMPVMDGIKTLHVLREASPKTAIVMMDSMPEFMLDESKKEGALTCIHKPFNIKEVRTVISEIIKKGEANDRR